MTTTPAPDPNTIGISYSGGGPLLAVELGIAQAFVQMNIKPTAICGASAGAIAATAHALDVDAGQGIELAIEELGHMTNSSLRLDAGDFALRLLREGTHLKSVGDNQPAAEMVSRVVARLLGSSNLTIGSFGQELGGRQTPTLQVVSTDVLTQDAYWFPSSATLQEALVASSAIPGIFPWRVNIAADGNRHYLVDGGVVENQPLQQLANLGCGAIYACAVGAGPLQTEPSNLIDNVLRSINISMHACSEIEEDRLRHQLPAGCKVIHIHPPTTIPLPDFNFTPELVGRVVDEARTLTMTWLEGNPQT